MAILHYESLTHTDLQALPRDRTVVMLTVSPLEQHGPHLPYGTDPIQATMIGELLVERLHPKFPEWNWLFLPPISLGCDTMINQGSIEIKPITLRAVVYDHLQQLAKDGFKNVIALNAHAGPRHVVILEELAAKVRWRHRMRMISASSRIIVEVLKGNFVERIDKKLQLLEQKLSDEERKGLKHDYHGGMLETSMMLALRPDLVKPMYRELRPEIVERMWKIGRKSAAQTGKGLGYLGSPALARPEIGRAAIEAIFDEVLPLIERFLNGEDVRKDFRSKFYYIPIFRTDFKWMIFIALYAGAFGTAWIILVRLMADMAK